MSQFIIEGGRPLSGEITASGNKNAVLPMIAACLLTDEEPTGPCFYSGKPAKHVAIFAKAY